jgi:hypothetical protein
LSLGIILFALVQTSRFEQDDSMQKSSIELKIQLFNFLATEADADIDGTIAYY